LGEEERGKGKKNELSNTIQREGNLMESHHKKERKKKVAGDSPSKEEKNIYRQPFLCFIFLFIFCSFCKNKYFYFIYLYFIFF
jgi:hypothetical protein